MQSKLNINEMYAGSRKLFDPAAKSYLMDHHRYAVKGGSISSNAPFGTSNEPTNYFTEHSLLWRAEFWDDQLIDRSIVISTD